MFSYIMDLWYFIWLWNFAPFHDLIKDLLLMFDNMTFYFGAIINVNVITRISAIFECC